jgi:myb proto-oncogene protein
LDPSIDRVNVRMGEWTEDEDIKLKDAAQMHGGKNWAAIAELVSGRTTSQCSTRWMKALNPSIDHANGLKGKWTEDEDSKLKDSVQRHGGKDWDAISALIPGRTEKQCQNRWHNALVLKTVLPTERRGKWAKDEDIKLKDAVQTYGGNNWVAIAVLVPGRTKKQCYDRWHNASDYRIDKAETDVQVP